MNKLPEWPAPLQELSKEPFGGGVLIEDALEYERSYANAAMERLRVAVEALRTIGLTRYTDVPQSMLAEPLSFGTARTALKTIGELPEA